MESEDEYPTEDQIKELIEYSRANQRICPRPDKWKELWETLPGKKLRIEQRRRAFELRQKKTKPNMPVET